MKTKILRNIFFSVSVLFALARWLDAGPMDGVLNLSNAPSIPPQSTVSTFDVPGAGTGPGQGTMPYAINPGGTIMGFYLDASNVYYGFLRAPNGVITTFSVPGAGTGPYQGTEPLSINPAGTIAGIYQDAGGAYHAFARDRNDGGITTFDVPGAGTGPHQGTVAENINPARDDRGNLQERHAY